jgi:hypothetical protein
VERVAHVQQDLVAERIGTGALERGSAPLPDVALISASPNRAASVKVPSCTEG